MTFTAAGVPVKSCASSTYVFQHFRTTALTFLRAPAEMSVGYLGMGMVSCLLIDTRGSVARSGVVAGVARSELVPIIWEMTQ